VYRIRFSVGAGVLLSIVGLFDLVFGVRDMAFASTPGGHVIGALVFVVGLFTLAPVALLMRDVERGLDPLATYIAATMVLAQGVALGLAEGSSATLGTWRLVAPVVSFVVFVLVLLMLRLQRGKLERPLKFGLSASLAALVLSALQIGVALTSSTRPAPGRLLLTTRVTRHADHVEVTISGTNHGATDLPILGDLFDVVALKCPASPVGPTTARISRDIRRLQSFNVMGWLETLEVAGCRKPVLVDTGTLVGEGGFVPPAWSGTETHDYALPSGRNTICVYESMFTINRDLERIGYSPPADDKQGGVVFRYPLEATGWIDSFVHPKQEVVVHWTPTTERYAAPPESSYQVPSESTEYTVNGASQHPSEFLSRRGGVVTSSTGCS
jgi:hypothetical protein